MNAVEFVRKFGFKASHELMNAESWTIRQIAMFTCIDDKDELQRLVDSWELISKQYDGLENAKELLRISPKLTEEIRFLAQAIRDVESIGGGV